MCIRDRSKSDGADQTLGLRFGGTAARNGEPFGELALIQPGDAAWQAQHGPPRDPFVFVHASRDVLRSAGLKPIESPGTADPWLTAPATAATTSLGRNTGSTRATKSSVGTTSAHGFNSAFSITGGTHRVTGTRITRPVGPSRLTSGHLCAKATQIDALGNKRRPKGSKSASTRSAK